MAGLGWALAERSEPAAVEVEAAGGGLGQPVEWAGEEVEAGSRLRLPGQRIGLEATGWVGELSGCSAPKTKQKGERNPFSS